MSASPDLVISSLQKLIHEQFITIDEDMEESTGIRSERYNLTPLYRRLAKQVAEQELAKLSAVRPTVPIDEGARNIFSTFEKSSPVH